MVTRDDVLYAYRLLLGREPENDAVVEAAVQHHSSLQHLRQTFMNSREFASIAAATLGGNRFPLDLEQPVGPIDVSCDTEHLRQLMARVERKWTGLGDEEPYWSVLTQPSFKKASFEEHQDAYWNSGQDEVNEFLAWINRNGVSLPPGSTCLEYGCGTGRVTGALAALFQNIIACDISASHLALARQALSKQASPVQFIHIRSLAALDQLPEFDVLFSILVLQHNPPPLISFILDKLLGRLRPGGIAYFQVPTFRVGYTFKIADYLAEEPLEKVEMHVLPQRRLHEVARNSRCDVLELQPDNKTGVQFISTTVLLRKSDH